MKKNIDMITNELLIWSFTFFSKDSIHISFNSYYTRAIFVEIFDNNNQGIMNSALNFFFFDEWLIQMILRDEITLIRKKLEIIYANKKKFLVNDSKCLIKCEMKYSKRNWSYRYSCWKDWNKLFETSWSWSWSVFSKRF